MRKIKICYVITQVELGGAQLSVLSLIESLDKEIYECSVVTGVSGELLPEVSSIEGVRVVLCSSLRRAVNIFSDVRAFFFLWRFFTKENPDIVHSHSSKAGILARLAARCVNVKAIAHTVHGWGFHGYQRKFVRKCYIMLERIAAWCCDAIIVVTEYDKQLGIACGIGHDAQYVLIRYQIKEDQFRAQHNGLFKKEFCIEENSFVVGMIACFKPQKSLFDFIAIARRIVQQVPRVKFVLVGDGQLRKEIMRTIHKQGLADKFILTGWRRDIPVIMSSFDVLALTSLWEGLPIVFLEAMASAKPIVATDICGNREIIKDGENGYLVAPQDYDAFANRVAALYGDQGRAREMGERGRCLFDKHYSTFSMNRCALDLYRRLYTRKETASW